MTFRTAIRFFVCGLTIFSFDEAQASWLKPKPDGFARTEKFGNEQNVQKYAAQVAFLVLSRGDVRSMVRLDIARSSQMGNETPWRTKSRLDQFDRSSSTGFGFPGAKIAAGVLTGDVVIPGSVGRVGHQAAIGLLKEGLHLEARSFLEISKQNALGGHSLGSLIQVTTDKTGRVGRDAIAYQIEDYILRNRNDVGALNLLLQNFAHHGVDPKGRAVNPEYELSENSRTTLELLGQIADRQITQVQSTKRVRDLVVGMAEDLGEILARDIAEDQRQQKLQSQRERFEAYQYRLGEYQASGEILGYLLMLDSGNANLGRAVQVATAETVKAIDLVHRATASADVLAASNLTSVGTLTATAGVMGAGFAIAGMFAGGGDAEGEMLKAIMEMLQQLFESLRVMDKKLDAIIKMQKEQFENLRKGMLNLDSRAAQILNNQLSLSRQIQGLKEVVRVVGREEFEREYAVQLNKCESEVFRKDPDIRILESCLDTLGSWTSRVASDVIYSDLRTSTQLIAGGDAKQDWKLHDTLDLLIDRIEIQSSNVDPRGAHYSMAFKHRLMADVAKDYGAGEFHRVPNPVALIGLVNDFASYAMLVKERGLQVSSDIVSPIREEMRELAAFVRSTVGSAQFFKNFESQMRDSYLNFMAGILNLRQELRARAEGARMDALPTVVALGGGIVDYPDPRHGTASKWTYPAPDIKDLIPIEALELYSLYDKGQARFELYFGPESGYVDSFPNPFRPDFKDIWDASNYQKIRYQVRVDLVLPESVFEVGGGKPVRERLTVFDRTATTRNHLSGHQIGNWIQIYAWFSPRSGDLQYEGEFNHQETVFEHAYEHELRAAKPDYLAQRMAESPDPNLYGEYARGNVGLKHYPWWKRDPPVQRTFVLRATNNLKDAEVKRTLLKVREKRLKEVISSHLPQFDPISGDLREGPADSVIADFQVIRSGELRSSFELLAAHHTRYRGFVDMARYHDPVSDDCIRGMRHLEPTISVQYALSVTGVPVTDQEGKISSTVMTTDGKQTAGAQTENLGSDETESSWVSRLLMSARSLMGLSSENKKASASGLIESIPVVGKGLSQAAQNVLDYAQGRPIQVAKRPDGTSGIYDYYLGLGDLHVARGFRGFDPQNQKPLCQIKNLRPEVRDLWDLLNALEGRQLSGL